MTQEEVVAAINGATFEASGQVWTITVTRVELKAPEAFLIRLAIVGSTNHRGELHIGQRNASDTKWLRAVAIGAARDIVTGKLPPGTRELL
jgi:hypothetical protein